MVFGSEMKGQKWLTKIDLFLMPKKAESWFWSLISHESLIWEVRYPWLRQPVDSFGWFYDTRIR